MAELGPGHDCVIRTTYPHMLGDDTAVWTRFLESGLIEIDKVWYDVHVGKAVAVQNDTDGLLSRVADGLTRKRIDVVALVGAEYWVIEVKPIAQHFAIGQVLVYTGLFNAEYSPALEAWPVIVCDTIDEDVVPECIRQGVMVIANLD